MRALLDKMMAQLREYFGKMSRGNKVRLAILSAVIIVLAIVTVSLLTRTNYATMYNAKDSAEAGDVIAALREMNVSYRIEGTRVLVPENRVSELQASLASQGIIGAVGPDLTIMEDAAGFAVTERHANQLYAAQRAADIRAAILTSPKIQNAIVTVNPGESSPLFRAPNVREATCSVMLTLNRGATLTNQEAQSIAEHVRRAVQGISYENISITDNNFNYYKVGEEIMDFDTEMNSRIRLQDRLIDQTKIAGEQLLIPVFGMENVRINPTIRLNFDKVVTESVEFAPPVAGEMDGIVRSYSDMWEAQRRDDAAEGVPGTDTNAMGTVEYPYGTLEDNERYARAVIEKNYEINETRTIIEQAQGKIEFISVAVVINANSVEEDYTNEVENLVSAGLGIAPEHVSVVRMPFFVDTSTEDAKKEQEEFEARERQKELIQTIIMWSVILLLGIALMALIRTIIKTVKPPPEPEQVLADGGYSINYIADDDDTDDIIEGEDVTDVTQLKEVELQTKSSGVEQIERFIDKDPAAVAQLLRNWLTDE